MIQELMKDSWTCSSMVRFINLEAKVVEKWSQKILLSWEIQPYLSLLSLKQQPPVS